MKARIKSRVEYKGRPIKEEAKQFEGRLLEFRYGWEMDDDDPYPGETAWIPVDGAVGRVIAWFASGDLEVIDKANGE